MKLFFRLIYTLIVSWFRKQIHFMDECETRFTCLPTDLDILIHMTNAQYFSIMDIARLDFIIRSGLQTQLLKHGYYSVVEAQTIRFKKSILPFDKFRVITHIVGWDEKSFYQTQKFVRGHTVMTEAVVKIRFLKKKRTVTPTDLLKSIDQFQVSPKIDDSILTWNRTLYSNQKIKSKI